MITFQKRIHYVGEATKAPLKSVTLALQLPMFDYVASSENSLKEFVRHESGAIESGTAQQALTATTYRVEVDDSAIAGSDEAQRVLAIQYYGRALVDGNVNKLFTSATVQYLSDDGLVFGGQTIDFICLIKIDLDAASDIKSVGKDLAAQKVGWLAINKSAYSALRDSLAGTSLNGDHSLTLQAISLVTARVGNAPAFREDVLEDFSRWLDRRARGSDAAAILEILRKYFELLFDFTLAIPEIKMLKIAGNVTITAPTGTTVVPGDFPDLEISASLSFEDAPPRTLAFRFTDLTKITGATAPFSLTGTTHLYGNGVRSPIVVRARGPGMEVWSREFTADDPKLANIEIRVPKPSRQVLTPPPKDTRDSASKKLRGRVLTLSKDCPLKDVLVLIQARRSTDAPWKTVGAAATDSAGNFSIPYPYGAYVQARAMVSISPKETADLAISGTDEETISDDFIYLLLTNPDCGPGDDHEDCGCETDKPNRLPDHADLVGSDLYSQDIGGTCVNLSKPNRTISEFNYQAIVRASDPDVANYTLTRIETGLDAIDVATSVALTNGATELGALSTSARARAQQMYQDTGGTPIVARFAEAIENAFPHATAVAAALTRPGAVVTATVLGDTLHHVDAVIAILEAHKTRAEVESGTGTFYPEAAAVLNSANRLRPLMALAIDTIGCAARFELTGGAGLRSRQPISLGNPIAWQDTPETQTASAASSQSPGKSMTENYRKSFGNKPAPVTPPDATFSQAVTIATGHILHYKAEFKSDGYSLGDLIYSLPLAPGQKKEIVVFEASHTLLGAESQSLAQNERLALGLINERDITNQLGGRLSESLRGNSSANTSGLSAGFGTAGQGSGGGQGMSGSGGVVIGVAGGFANANSTASQDSSRDVSQFFGEKLRQSIMQNAEGYRQLNASVVSTVQEGQRYGVTSEVVANHNHCHALTMMYFEVLRHYAIFQKLSSVEECVFVPLLLTKFTTENVARWRDVLAPALLPMPSETYLKPADSVNAARPHPLLKAFDADQRIRTNYANVDMPAGSYDDERIQFIRGSMRLRANFPRPRTRFDRIMSLPVTTQTLTSRVIDPEATATAALEFPRKLAEYATKTAVTAGFNVLFGEMPPDPPGIQYKTVEKQILVREAIFDTFMKLDANYESVPPAQCIRVTNFSPPPRISLGLFGNLPVLSSTAEDFFADNEQDRQQWQAYATLLGYSSVLKMLNAHFRGNLISEWDTIFNTDIAPLVFEKVLAAIRLQQFTVDFASEAKYRGGERLLRVNLAGTTSQKRNQLPQVLRLDVTTNAALTALKQYITLDVQDLTITYATSHFNGTLFSGSVGDDLLDGTDLFIPESSEEKRNPRREDRYLAAKLIEHLNSHLEYYNKVLWYNLDADRRYMLLDGFTIQVYNDDGTPITTPEGMRSLASVVKNDVIAVAGNSLVLPVAPGYRVSGAFIQAKAEGATEVVTLFDHYKPITPVEPYRISVPSKGVFAEAVQGVCNACEKIETDRLQDWNRFPNTDEPTPILPVATPTPTVTDWKAAFKDFSTPIVNIQNAPALPAAGEGLQGLSELLGKSGVFKDITGLEGNQANVIRTYLSNQENAKAFGEMAKEMAMQQHNTQNAGKIMDSINSAKDSGAINQDDYSKLVKDHLQQQIDGGKTRAPAITAGDSQLAAVTADAVRTRTPIEASQTFPDGTVATIKQGGGVSTTGTFDFTVPGTFTPLQQPSPETCWAAVIAMLKAWKAGAPATSVAAEIGTLAGPYPALLATNQQLVTADKNALLGKLGLVIDPLGLSSAMPDQYLQTMQKYGPLWATVDGNLGAKSAEHAKIIYGIRGDGSAAGTMLRIIDPRGGARIEQTFEAFMHEFEELARAGGQVSLNGQIVRFADSIAGEGASTDSVYDILTDVARVASMGLQANPAAKLLPVPTGTDPYSFEHNWSDGWTGKTVVSSTGLESTALEFPLEHKMAGTTMPMPFRVLDKLEWSNARVTFGTDTFPLPLTRRFLLAADRGNGPLPVRAATSVYFPLEATVQSRATLLFGYVVDVGSGAVVPLDLNNAPVEGFEVWLRNGGTSQAVTTNKRIVLALYDLTMNEPLDDFSPKPHAPLAPGPTYTARLYPLLSVWCANPCEEAAADLSMTRPATSAMTEDMMPGAAIGGSFYADTNDRIHTVWEDTDPAVRDPLLDTAPFFIENAGLILAWKNAPSPRWSSLFAHYRLGSDLPATAVVDRSKGTRVDLLSRKERMTPTATPVATPVTKVAGQAAFDNIHMAPDMVYKGAAAFMAPICQHDCLHLHWRWSQLFSDKPVWGWSGGAPYAKAGAPMIPENQNLDVALTGSTFTYLPAATAVKAMQWQIFMHHGMAYAIKLTSVGAALPLLEITAPAGVFSSPPWQQFYYHNRFWETGGANRAADVPRLDEGTNQANFAPLERM